MPKICRNKVHADTCIKHLSEYTKGEVIRKVLFTSEQSKRGQMAFRAALGTASNIWYASSSAMCGIHVY